MTKNRKTLVFTTLDILQLKKLMIVNVFTMWIFVFACWSCKWIYWGKNGNKYLFFDSTDENKELLKKYNDIFNGIRDKIKEISSGECDYEKDYMKIKFNSDDDLTLNKPLKFRLITINIRSVFEEDDKLYPQVFLDNTLYKLNI